MSFKSIVRELRDMKDGIVSLSRRGVEGKHWRSRTWSYIAPDLPPSEPIEQRQWANLPAELLLDIIRRVEQSERSWQARSVVVYCASVCKSWREITKEIAKTPEECGKLTFPISLKQPGPRDSPIQCFIKRDRATSMHHLYFGLAPCEDESNKLLVAAKKIRRATSSDFVISLVADDFSRASNAYLGKLRSNLATKFTIYDSQPPNDAPIHKSGHLSRRFHTKQVSPKVLACNYNVATISYELNVLRTRGPRINHCVIPVKRPPNRLSNNAIVKHQRRNIHINHNLFEETSQRDISYVNSILSSYIRGGDAPTTWDFFLVVHRTQNYLSSYTFTPVLKACSVLPDVVRGQQVHALMIKTGSDTEIITKTALIDMYSKYGYLDDSVRVFNQIGSRDVVTWNAMLSSYLRHDMPIKAISVLKEMRKERVEFSEFTLCSVLKACTFLKAYQQGKQIHGLIVVIARDLVVLSTALIDFYSHLGYIDEAMKIYDTLNLRKDDIIYNSLISGCVLNKKYDMAISIMSKIRPNMIALTSSLAACSENSDLWIGKQIHGVAIRRGFVYDTQLCNAILDMYAKCGKILCASVVFEAIDRKNVVSWTSMIDAFGRYGYGVEAVDLFKKMGEEGNNVFPNSVTFLAVLSACGHSGLVEEGRECFVLVQEKYGLEPGPEHYACLIDTLGRAGRTEEVWNLFHDMVDAGSKPTAAVWAALLNACKLNQDVERGEFAAKHLLESEPDNPGNYIAVSNFFAAMGRWDFVNKLRSVMKNKGLAKERGSSWIDEST